MPLPSLLAILMQMEASCHRSFGGAGLSAAMLKVHSSMPVARETERFSAKKFIVSPYRSTFRLDEIDQASRNYGLTRFQGKIVILKEVANSRSQSNGIVPNFPRTVPT